MAVLLNAVGVDVPRADRQTPFDILRAATSVTLFVNGVDVTPVGGLKTGQDGKLWTQDTLWRTYVDGEVTVEIKDVTATTTYPIKWTDGLTYNVLTSAQVGYVDTSGQQTGAGASYLSFFSQSPATAASLFINTVDTGNNYTSDADGKFVIPSTELAYLVGVCNLQLKVSPGDTVIIPLLSGVDYFASLNIAQ